MKEKVTYADVKEVIDSYSKRELATLKAMWLNGWEIRTKIGLIVAITKALNAEIGVSPDESFKREQLQTLLKSAVDRRIKEYKEKHKNNN